MTNKLEPGKDIKDNTDNTWHPTGLWHRHLCITYSESKVESKSSPSNMFKRVQPKKMGSLEKWFDPWNWLLLWLSPANHWFRKENDPHFSMMFRESICCFYRKGITVSLLKNHQNHWVILIPSFNEKSWRFGQSSIPESGESPRSSPLTKTFRNSAKVTMSLSHHAWPGEPREIQESGAWNTMDCNGKETNQVYDGLWSFQGTSERPSGSSTRWRPVAVSVRDWDRIIKWSGQISDQTCTMM